MLLLGAARRHRGFVVVLACGTALRSVAFLAYRPALLYPDSEWYIEMSSELHPSTYRPIGYPVFLALLPLRDGLAVVPLAQHLLALAVAALLYALLIRLGVRPWMAALATAPFLLDAFQLLIEQAVMSELPFELLVVVICALLLWRRPVGVLPAGLAGILLAAAVLIRPVALLLILPAALMLLLTSERRSRPLAAVTLVVLFGVALGGYAAWFHSAHGTYALSTSGGVLLYARVGAFADCSSFALPADERVLCDTRSLGGHLSANRLAWSDRSPLKRLDRRSRRRLAGDFARRVIRHQPADYAKAVLFDVLRCFTPTRTQTPHEPVPFSAYWAFQPQWPSFRHRLRHVARRYGDNPGSNHTLVSILRAYQRVAFTPGPLLAAALILGGAVALGIGSARRSPMRAAAFLLTGCGVILVAVPALVLGFSPRFQLPQLVLLPPALALAVTALTSPDQVEIAGVRE